MTKDLRADLRRSGFRCYAWGLGFNRGSTPDIIERIDGRVQWIIDRTGYAPALVGWSLGGIYAREYAKHHPDKVARVVTLGSPFSGSRRANRAWRLYHLIARHPVDNPPIDFHPAPRLEMPTFALWSSHDGVVAINKLTATEVAHLEEEGASFANKNPDGTVTQVEITAIGVEMCGRDRSKE